MQWSIHEIDIRWHAKSLTRYDNLCINYGNHFNSFKQAFGFMRQVETNALSQSQFEFSYVGMHTMESKIGRSSQRLGLQSHPRRTVPRAEGH